MADELVSIVIPTYNSQKDIVRLLKSIKNQSYSKIESIVVDDGSSDKTVDISKKYANKVYARKHSERSVQRNFGASKAKGKYLLFLDSDMELTKNVVQDCIDTITNSKFKALIIPEETMGNSFISKVRRFERDMYKGNSTYEVARFFEKKVFNEVGGYDKNLTGAEDYDLPYRVSKKYKVGWAKESILHHEHTLSIWQLLKKKYYYAKMSVTYADKHPELVSKQGTIFFRKVYLTNWKKFVKNPFIGISFIVVRFLTMIAAILGYIKGAGFKKFIVQLYKLFF